MTSTEMLSPPPPYTAVAAHTAVAAPKPKPVIAQRIIATQNSTPVIDQKSVRILRFLLDIIGFSHEADMEALRAALASTPFASEDSSNAFERATTLLHERERSELLHLAKTIERARERVEAHQASLITDDEYHLLYTDVVYPASKLNLFPAFVFHWLSFYPEHENHPKKRNKSAPYVYSSRFLGLSVWDQEGLERHLSSIDLFLEGYAPNEEVKLLLGRAAAKFGNKHWWDRNTGPVKRMLRADSSSSALLGIINQRTTKRNTEMRKKALKIPTGVQEGVQK
jgi:hypothetical protein